MSSGARAIALAIVCAGRIAAAAPSVAVVIDATDDGPLGAPAHQVLVTSHDARIDAVPLDVGFPDSAAATLGAGDSALVDAEHQFHDMELDQAVASANKAREVFEAHLAELAQRETGTTPLRDAHIALAKAKFFAGDVEGSKDALRRAFAIDGKLVYGPTLFPRQMKKAVIEARMLFDTIGTGPLEITSEPPGADITIDGRATGAHTPATIDESAGPHELALTLPDHVTASKRVDVDDRGEKVALTLAKRTGNDVDARALTRALPAPDVRACAALARTLGVEALVLVHLDGKGDSFEARGQLWYATRERGALGIAVERSGPVRALDGELESMERALVDELLERRAALAVAVEPPRENKLVRFRRSKAFWYVVGGVAGAVVVGLGVGLGVGLSEAHQRDVNTVLLGGR